MQAELVSLSESSDGSFCATSKMFPKVVIPRLGAILEGPYTNNNNDDNNNVVASRQGRGDNTHSVVSAAYTVIPFIGAFRRVSFMLHPSRLPQQRDLAGCQYAA